VTHIIAPEDAGEYGRELATGAAATINDLDHCPRCGRRVSDYDERGRENDDGQRECNGQCPGEPWTGRLPHTARDSGLDAAAEGWSWSAPSVDRRHYRATS
jgi:hypothetical protein